jgi:hypothetical protein
MQARVLDDAPMATHAFGTAGGVLLNVLINVTDPLIRITRLTSSVATSLIPTLGRRRRHPGFTSPRFTCAALMGAGCCSQRAAQSHSEHVGGKQPDFPTESRQQTQFLRKVAMNRLIQKSLPTAAAPPAGAKVALLTTKGLMVGSLISWSDDGAVVEALGDGLVGSEVRLRDQAPDRICEKKATVLWVNERGLGLEFEPDRPAAAKGFSVFPRIQKFFLRSRAVCPRPDAVDEIRMDMRSFGSDHGP